MVCLRKRSRLNQTVKVAVSTPAYPAEVSPSRGPPARRRGPAAPCSCSSAPAGGGSKQRAAARNPRCLRPEGCCRRREETGQVTGTMTLGFMSFLQGLPRSPLTCCGGFKMFIGILVVLMRVKRVWLPAVQCDCGHSVSAVRHAAFQRRIRV